MDDSEMLGKLLSRLDHIENKIDVKHAQVVDHTTRLREIEHTVNALTDPKEPGETPAAAPAALPAPSAPALAVASHRGPGAEAPKDRSPSTISQYAGVMQREHKDDTAAVVIATELLPKLHGSPERRGGTADASTGENITAGEACFHFQHQLL